MALRSAPRRLTRKEQTRAAADLAVSMYRQTRVMREPAQVRKPSVPLYLALARDAIIRQR
jgi:hypothetical protein